ncbi:efflux RND transporter permease subunit [Rubinisphaera italica]|uniref:efflux RND transporter permease subunit n=1 Tax=Rubinisphaera italica TaxID=2527969 RepID=UPI0011B6898E|nr:efflux RND transporter permease subunit [Rubinisphaera italica]
MEEGLLQRPVIAPILSPNAGLRVYERLGEFQFRRKRFVVQRTTLDLAVLESGADEGSEIVIGGIAGAFLCGGVISLGSLIGFVTVLGVAARNGIMMIDHYRHLEHNEGVPFGTDIILRGASERLAPILMTALTLVPIILGGNIPGHEIEFPVAFIILGGLTTSTLLNLLVVPTFYYWLMKPRSI